MNGNETDRNRGEFQRGSRSVATPVAVDGSEWSRGSGARTSGAFVRATKSVPTPVVVDASKWVVPRLAAVTEELTVLLSALDDDQRVQAIETLVNVLNEKHRLNLTLTRKIA